MDRFKFRAWNKRLKEMEYLTSLYWFEENGVKEDGDNDFKLMQSTGLKDKNGKLIFEGDILKSKYGPADTIDFVISDHSARYRTGNGCDIGHENNLEIIGNIHENPERLNVQPRE